MKALLLGATLLGMAGLIGSSLPAAAASSTAVAETPTVKSSAIQLAEASRPYDPSAGSVGYKKKKKKKGKK